VVLIAGLGVMLNDSRAAICFCRLNLRADRGSNCDHSNAERRRQEESKYPPRHAFRLPSFGSRDNSHTVTDFVKSVVED